MDKQRSQAEEAYLDAFAQAADSLPGGEWLAPARRSARDRFAETGLPHRRLEAWRWTDLRSMLDKQYPPVLDGRQVDADLTAERSPFAAVDRHIMVFVDGRYQDPLSDVGSLGDQVELVRIGDGLENAPQWLKDNLGRGFADDNDPLANLNTMFVSGGVAIRVPKGMTVDKPVEVLCFSTGTAPETLNTRVLIVLEDGAQVTLLDTHLGTGSAPYVANTWCEVILGDGAEAHHVKVQDEGASAVHLANIHAVIGGKATFNSLSLSCGAQTARNHIKARLEGEGGHVGIAAAYMLGDRQHCDTALLVDHAVPECTSNELFKCVMDDHSRGIFQGKIIVRPDAQKTDGMQMTQGLLLSETAEFDAKPELEIFADDVRCTHGATSGELDEDLMFYLRSRGIPEQQAKSLLIAAFIGEAIEEVASEELRDLLNAFVAARHIGGEVEA